MPSAQTIFEKKDKIGRTSWFITILLDKWMDCVSNLYRLQYICQFENGSGIIIGVNKGVIKGVIKGLIKDIDCYEEGGMKEEGR